MKTRIKLLLGASLALPVMGFSPVMIFALDATTTTTNTTATQPEDTTDSSKQLSPQDKAVIQQRVQERKDKVKTRLATAEQQRLLARCENAQGKVSSLYGRIKGIETSHTEVYGGLVSRLDELSVKLKAANVDTAQLESQITELKAKIATFNTDLTDYKNAVGDVKDMDCKADTAGFKVSLDASRTGLETVRKDAAAIRAYVKDTIRPTLQAIRQKLDPTATTATKDATPETETTTQQTTSGGGTQ